MRLRLPSLTEPIGRVVCARARTTYTHRAHTPRTQTTARHRYMDSAILMYGNLVVVGAVAMWLLLASRAELIFHAYSTCTRILSALLYQ